MKIAILFMLFCLLVSEQGISFQPYLFNFQKQLLARKSLTEQELYAFVAKIFGSKNWFLRQAVLSQDNKLAELVKEYENIHSTIRASFNAFRYSAKERIFQNMRAESNLVKEFGEKKLLPDDYRAVKKLIEIDIEKLFPYLSRVSKVDADHLKFLDSRLPAVNKIVERYAYEDGYDKAFTAYRDSVGTTLSPAGLEGTSQELTASVKSITDELSEAEDFFILTQHLHGKELIKLARQLRSNRIAPNF